MGYTVTFADGSTFEGGNPAKSLWDSIPDKPIQSIEYALTPYQTYRFSDFESYNHCVERVRGVNNGAETISKVIIMGQVGSMVHQIMLDASGAVYKLVVPFGAEYSPQIKIVDDKFAGWLKGRPLSGWRKGAIREGFEGKLEIIKSYK